MVVVSCIGHSGFTVETESSMMIFDYSVGNIERLPENKKLYVFISHAHEDHFNPEIFRICASHPSVKYIISSDIDADKLRASGVGDVLSAEPGMDLRIGGKFRLKVLPSTDAGVAFLACCAGRNIFHAGDLNLWLWDTMSEPEVYAAAEVFKEYTKGLKGFTIDLAFLPLDSRQGVYAPLGLEYYLKHFRIDRAVPMHFSGNDSMAENLIADPRSKSYRNKIVCMGAGKSEYMDF